MSSTTSLWLVLAGLGGGLTGSVAGLASLVSYPSLLAVGLSPVAANVTNTVAIVASSVGSTIGSRRELAGQGQRLRQLWVVSAAGGLFGALLLLITPAGAFARAAPLFIGAGSVAILLRPTRGWVERRSAAGDSRLLGVIAFLIATYGGYFGAAAGILMLSALLAATAETLARSNAAKNVVMGVTNAVAAVAFVVLGPVHWSAVLPLGLGFLVGGRLGPIVVRHTPAHLLRIVIAVAGLALAVHLGLSSR